MVRKLSPPIFKIFDARDLETAREGLNTIYSAPANVDLLEKRAAFGMRMRAADLGSLTLARVEIANWRLTRDAGECVVLTLPLGGEGQYRHENMHRIYAGQGYIAVARPFQTYVVDCVQGTGMGLTIPAKGLLAQVERLTGETASASLLSRAVDEIDSTVSVGRTLARTMKAAMAELTDLAAVGMGGLATANYQELLVNLAIAALFPEVAEAMGATPADCGSVVVRRARDYIRDRAAEPMSLGRLAADLGVSMRAMQENFQRRYGLSPRAYLMDCRLEIAHQRLEALAPASSVTEIALDSGFQRPQPLRGEVSREV